MLDSQKIAYNIYNHLALHSVEDSIKLRGNIPGAHTKNLFLKNKKNKFFLFSCLEETIIDLKILNKKLSLGNISFAKEKYLNNMLNVKSGAVTPFGLLNDKNNTIKFYLDKKVLSFDYVNFHPLDNRFTVSIHTRNFISFLKNNNIFANIVDFDNYMII
tara:strand:+ start:244 stop:720 length:477 start_codon:yes stop_codon:yes gene_type:complete